MNIVSPTTQDHNPTHAAFLLTGQWVDEQVAKGRALNDILTIEQNKAGGDLWFDKANLRPYSSAVAAAFENDPTFAPAVVDRGIRIVNTSKQPQDQRMWNDLADQLLEAQQASQQPLTFALAEQVFPDMGSNVQGAIFTAAYERLRAAQRQIMRALGEMPALAAA